MEGQENRNEIFLDLYKRMEDVLEEKYRGARRHFTSVVMEYLKDGESAPIRDKLEVCRELRNLLTHNANLGGEPVAQPSGPIVEAMKDVLHYVSKPPLALEFATRGDQVMKADMNQKVLNLMEIMDKNGYSHIPVMENGVFRGVFSAGSVFQYLLEKGGKGMGRDTVIRDLEKYIELKNHMENYRFVSRDATYLTVRAEFEKVRGKNKRVSAIFITEHGKPGERLLGMLTPWDVLGDPDSPASS